MLFLKGKQVFYLDFSHIAYGACRAVFSIPEHYASLAFFQCMYGGSSPSKHGLCISELWYSCCSKIVAVSAVIRECICIDQIHIDQLVSVMKDHGAIMEFAHTLQFPENISGQGCIWP